MTMKYIDFGSVQKISKKDVATFLDVYSILKKTIPKNSLERLTWEDHLERIHDRFEEIPHCHISSILSKSCLACYCDLPGPEGEWE